ncbi:MAG: hypothetical protein U0599_06840 [Vicinamibacteria bacterium]
MTRTPKAAAAAAVALGLAACASSTYKSSWSNPEARAVSLAGKKVVAVFVTAEGGPRYSAEDALARELTAAGAQGVTAYSLVPDADVKDKDAAKAKLVAAGVDGAVVMRVVGKDKELNYTPGMAVPVGYWGRPVYGSMWGGYWGRGWGLAYSPGYLTTDTVVSVETLVYSVNQDKLLWAGMSETTNPKKVNDFVRELARGAGAEMKKAGLLAPSR